MLQKNKIKFYFLALSAFFALLTSSKIIFALPVISDVGVTVSTSSVQVAWTANDTFQITNTKFEYGLDTNYFGTSTIRAFPGNVSGTKYYFATKISGLIPGSKIFYRIKVENSIGENSLHADTFIVPLPDNDPPIFSNISVASQINNATVSWDTNESVTCQLFYWQNNDAKKQKDLSSQSKSFHVYLGDLEMLSTYNYQIICKDLAGNKAESSIKNFSTISESKPPRVVSRFSAVYLGTGVNITWLNPSDPVFDKVKIVRSPSGAITSPNDGDFVYEGKAQKFYDSKVVYGRKYYYTIFTLDSRGQYGSGVTAIVGSGETIPESTVKSSDHISIDRFKFFTNNKSKLLTINNGTVSGGSQADLSINIPATSFTLPLESIEVVIGSFEAYQFEFSSDQNLYEVNLNFPVIGDYKSYIQIFYSNGEKDVVVFRVLSADIKPEIEKNPEKILENKNDSAIVNTVGAIAVITKDEEVQNKVNNVVAPTLVGVSAVGAISVLSWVNILPFLQLLIQPLSFVGRKKGAATGLVYNSLNKMPIDLATIRLLSRDTGQVVQSKVTDSQGRYAFTVNPGLYKLQVIKNGFVFPTQILRDFKDDGKKFDIYHGQTLESSMGNNIVAVNIPIDPVGDFDLPIFKLWGQKIFKSIQSYLVWVGLFIIIVSLYVSPRWYTAVLLPIQVLVLVMTQRLSQKPRAKSWGVVTDATTKRPIAQAIVRLFNAKINKLIGSQVTDSRGRYYFIAGEDQYYLTIEHPNYETKKTRVLDLVEKKSQTISVDVSLSSKQTS